MGKVARNHRKVRTKKKLVTLAIVGACLVPASASAHDFNGSHNCDAAQGMPCEGNLSDNEAVWFESYMWGTFHTGPAAPAFKWAHHRINSSATWVMRRTASPYTSENCLVDIDAVSGIPYRYYETCYYGDEGPQP